jgi:hypothetical protein
VWAGGRASSRLSVRAFLVPPTGTSGMPLNRLVSGWALDSGGFSSWRDWIGLRSHRLVTAAEMASGRRSGDRAPCEWCPKGDAISELVGRRVTSGIRVDAWR